MTRLAVLASFALAAGSAGAAPASNPAFLGIGMDPCPSAYCPRQSGVFVSNVTPKSAAAEAGLLIGDVIVSMDGKQVATLDQLSTLITNHVAGDEVVVEIFRRGEHKIVRPHLLTRAEVLYRRFVDSQIDLDVVDYDDARDGYNLDSLRGEIRIVAWFNAEQCAGCGAVIRKLADAAEARAKTGPTPKLLALTYGEMKHLEPMRLSSALGMPVAVGAEAYFKDRSLNESDRAYFMIVDRSGIVRFVTPIASDADDTEAQIDDVLAAAEHCTRR